MANTDPNSTQTALVNVATDTPRGPRPQRLPTHDPDLFDIIGPNEVEIDPVNIVNLPPPPTILKSEYTEGYHSFTGAETRVDASINGITIPLQDITTLSYSVYRDKYEVKTLGNSNVRGRTRGTRTVAGTIIFVHTHEHPLLKLMSSRAIRTTFAGNYYSDELVPLDLTLTFIKSTSSQENLISRLTLRGVEFTTEAATFSIHQPMTDMTVQYVALGVEPMVPYGAVVPGQAMERAPDPIPAHAASANDLMLRTPVPVTSSFHPDNTPPRRSATRYVSSNADHLDQAVKLTDEQQDVEEFFNSGGIQE